VIAGGPFRAFSDAEIAELLAGVGRTPDDDAFAAAVWSCLVEPGDAVGGVLRDVLGAATGLAVLADDEGDVLRTLSAAGVPDAARLGVAAAQRRLAPRCDPALVRDAFRFARVLGVRLVVPGDAHWPAGVDDLGVHGPAALWVRGRPEALAVAPSVALVGCRASSAYGEQVTAELANGLVMRGVAVHSGGAYGIDGMAHRAALAASGTTVAVMAGGVDRFYPAGHNELLQRVAESGAVVAEVACGTLPSRWRFLQRNRLLAAMTAATVVVEAGHRSGALNTASHARALDRPLAAVPGAVTSPTSAGCHRLLREPDVACVTSADDIVELIRPQLIEAASVDGPGRDAPDELRVLDALARSRPRSEAEVARRAGLAETVVRVSLAVLELEGRVAEKETGWIRCAS
jgi:DNA processing protein